MTLFYIILQGAPCATPQGPQPPTVSSSNASFARSRQERSCREVMEMEQVFSNGLVKSEENLVSSSKIGIAVLIFSFNLSIFVSCSFQLEHLWTFLFFSPPWQRKCLICEALQHKDPATAHVPWAAGEVFS